MQLERKTGDPSAVAGASILASLSSLKQDLSRWKSPSQTTNQAHQGTDVPAHLAFHDGSEFELDGPEDNSALNVESDRAADVGLGASDKNSPMDCDAEASTEPGNKIEEWNEALSLALWAAIAGRQSLE